MTEPRRRDAARTAVGAAAGAFLADIGAIEQLQQQMVEHTIGDTAGAEAFAGKTFAELTRPEMLKTRGGLEVVRRLAERGVLTFFGLMGAKFSAMVTGELLGDGSGRKGIFTFTPKAGVSPDSGPAHALQRVTVSQLGYTVGSTTGLLKRPALERAAAYYNDRAPALGIHPVRWTSVREWTQRAHAELYLLAVSEGATDLKDYKVDISRRL